MKHLAEFFKLNHNVIICCDDTCKLYTLTYFIVLFGNNSSQELFEFGKVVGHTPKELKALLIRNVEAIFDEESKEWLRNEIEKHRC